MLTIYGRTTSINVMKVLWTCGELGLAYRLTGMGRAHGRDRDTEVGRPPIENATYLALNPNGRIPTIDDDGFILWESNTIVRYLARRYGLGTLCPSDPCEQADSERWMDWQLTVLIGAVNPVFRYLIRTPEQRNEKAIEEGRRQTIVATAMLNDRLEHRAYLGGDVLTIGDISVGTVIHRWLALPVERPSMPHLERYHALLAERPAFREHIMQPLA